MGWQFIPWNLQYLFGGIIAILVTYIVFRKNPKSMAYRSFLAFGIFTCIWMFSVYLARNAPSEPVSREMYRIVTTAFNLTQPLLLLTLVNIFSGKRIYLLTLIPAIISGFTISSMGLYNVFSTDYGWSYSISSSVSNLALVITLAYFLAIVVVGCYLIKKAPLPFLKRKYKIILLASIIYFIPLTILNVVMWGMSKVPQFGGILLTMEFLIIAYAMILPRGKIESQRDVVKPS